MCDERIPPLRNERETEIKSEPIVQSPNIPQRGWPFTKFYRCTRAELAECSERGRNVGEQGVGVGHLFGCRWSSWKLLHRGTVGKRVARALVRWRTVDGKRRRAIYGNNPSSLLFFLPRTRTERVRTRGGEEGKEDKETGSRCGAKTRKREEKRAVERC